jgi:hypothetical protein
VFFIVICAAVALISWDKQRLKNFA